MRDLYMPAEDGPKVAIGTIRAAARWHDRYDQGPRPGFDLDGFEDEPPRTPVAGMVLSLAAVSGAGWLLLTLIHLLGAH